MSEKYKFLKFAATLLTVFSMSATAATFAQAEDMPAKQAFGAMKLPNLNANPQAIGFYSKGCVSGAVAMPIDGPDWQVMRLSRNRNWGHPNLIAMLQQLSRDAKKDGWNGLLIGDISQPRGGPMLTGHASHQVGLDADIWLSPMPKQRYNNQQREDVSAISMLKDNSLYVDPKKWTDTRTALLKHAASNPQVERLFVHPGIKKQLCDTVTGDRSWLGKVRPYWGHHYHFHIRMSCQPGSPNCKPQDKVAKGDGCDKSLAWWFTDEPWKPAKPSDKPAPKPQPMMVSALPKACAALLGEPSPASAAEVTLNP